MMFPYLRMPRLKTDSQLAWSCRQVHAGCY
jgi:hypothetical protein